MSIMFMQTADKNYSDLLDVTSVPTKNFCKEKGYLYNQVVGICRGYHPWHATFNRIILLKDALMSGYRGWVVYLDADAFVASQDFDLDLYIKNKQQFSFIAATGTDTAWWDINAGVFIMNMDSRVSHEIIDRWYDRFLSVSDDDLKKADKWDGVENDQDMLQDIFRSIGCVENIFVDREGILNYDGKFIKQIMRTAGGMEDRIRAAKNLIGSVQPNHGVDYSRSFDRDAYFESTIFALYKVFLGRVPDPEGLQYGIQNLRNGETIFGLIQSCMKSEEFRLKFPDFLKRNNFNF